MEPQTRSKIDPKIRQIGFSFSNSLPQNPNSSTTTTTAPLSHPRPVPALAGDRRLLSPTIAGGFDAGDSVLAVSPSDSLSEDWHRSNSGKYSLGFDMSGVGSPVAVDDDKDDTDTQLRFHHQKGAEVAEAHLSHKDMKPAPKSLKEKTSKAERRALQEAQRAAKAAKKSEASAVVAHGIEKPAKVPKQPPQKKDAPLASSVTVSEMKGADRPSDKDKKKDLPPPRMQYDDSSRVEKAKKRSVVKHTEARNRVELFRHLPQYEFENQLQDLESKYFKLDPVHPAVYKVGLQYLAGDISGSNARCIVMLHAFKEAIKDHHTPSEKTLNRDLTARISSYISFLNECRPISISMGNAIRSLKTCIAKLPLSLSESEAKAILCSDIDRYINEKIVIADKVIVEHAASKVRDGDVLLTYGASSVVEMVLVHAHEIGKQFRVVIVDSRPKLEGQALLRRLVNKGLSCTYTHINAVSYVMHEVTRVLLGAASILSNGTVYSRIGTACVAMVANAFRVPVLVCCEAYKFHERVQLDSICANELGNPDAITKVPGRKDVHYLDNWIEKGNLQLLNLLYDATPSDYVTLIVTDYGLVPPTSVPVIVREYRKEHLF